MAMSPSRLGVDALSRGTTPMIDMIDAWLRLAATRIHDAAPTLTALDQAIGDGDHGTNMDRGFAAIVAALDAGPPEADGELALAAARLRTV